MSGVSLDNEILSFCSKCGLSCRSTHCRYDFSTRHLRTAQFLLVEKGPTYPKNILPLFSCTFPLGEDEDRETFDLAHPTSNDVVQKPDVESVNPRKEPDKMYVKPSIMDAADRSIIFADFHDPFCLRKGQCG